MDLIVEPGKYVVAVSGGVDSMVLLNRLRQLPDLELIVAHYDHGIRHDSAEDRRFVEGMAAAYGLPFVYEVGQLGPHASEATARRARYDFLGRIQEQTKAAAIVTAHHQDDVLETAIFNLIRGTGRRGLSSLRPTLKLKRPLIRITKEAILAYALKQNISWREDSTNRDERYARNYIRHRLLVRFDADARQQLLALIDRTSHINDELDSLLEQQLREHGNQQAIDRQWFHGLDRVEAQEILAAWLRLRGIADFDRRTIERLSHGMQTLTTGKRLDVRHGAEVVISKRNLALQVPER